MGVVVYYSVLLSLGVSCCQRHLPVQLNIYQRDMNNIRKGIILVAHT